MARSVALGVAELIAAGMLKAFRYWTLRKRALTTRWAYVYNVVIEATIKYLNSWKRMISKWSTLDMFRDFPRIMSSKLAWYRMIFASHLVWSQADAQSWLTYQRIWGFPWPWGYPKCLVFNGQCDNFIKMDVSGGSPISGNHHISCKLKLVEMGVSAGDV